jgi:hypothetical protein
MVVWGWFGYSGNKSTGNLKANKRFDRKEKKIMKIRKNLTFRLVLGLALILAGGAIHQVGYAEFHWQTGGTHIAVYPAAFLILLGFLQIVRAFILEVKQT